MAAEPPLLPGAGEARRWAAEELAKPEYRENAPSWLDSLWRDFLEWLQSLDGSNGAGAVPSPAIAVVIAAVVAAAVILARPRLNARRRQTREVFERVATLGAADYRSRAEAAAAAGKWGDAVVDRFRAIVRSAEDRAILDPQPGRTADEAARALSLHFNTQASGLAGAAAIFDAIRYGNKKAGSASYRELVDLDAALESGKAGAAGSAAQRP